MKANSQTIILGLLVLCSFLSIGAQQKDPLPTRQLSEFANTPPDYCWQLQLKLYNISANSPTNESITVIARLGAKESKPNLNKRRLHNIQIYWTQSPQKNVKRNAESIILTEGKPTDRWGQIEFYVRGQLVEVIKLPQNRDLPTGDCYAGIDEMSKPCKYRVEKLSYPCIDFTRKQKRATLKKTKSR